MMASGGLEHLDVRYEKIGERGRSDRKTVRRPNCEGLTGLGHHRRVGWFQVGEGGARKDGFSALINLWA